MEIRYVATRHFSSEGARRASEVGEEERLQIRALDTSGSAKCA